MKWSYSKYQNILFALLLTSGAIKFIFNFYDFPIDITLLFVILISGDILLNFLTRFNKILFSSSQFFLLTVFFALFALIIFSLTYSKSDHYSFIKVTNFSLNMISFIYPIFMIKFNEKVFFRTLLILIIPATIIFLAAKNTYWYSDVQALKNKYMFFGGSYLLLGDILALGMFYLIKQRNYLFVIILMSLLLAIGAKGPSLFFLILTLIWKFQRIVNYKISKKIIKKLKTIALILIPIAFVFKDVIIRGFQFGIYRFSNFLDPFSTNTNDSRIDYFIFAIENTFNSVTVILFGHGIGSFGILYTGEDIRDFPHNIFLEAWFELGVLGVIFISILLIFPVLLKSKHFLFKIAALYMLFNYLKSGNLDGARVLFGIYGLLIFVNENNYEKG